MSDEYPKLRNVRPVPLLYGQERMIALQDPHNIADTEDMVMMPAEIFVVLANLFNGDNSIADIQTFLMRASGGALFPRENLEQIIDTLDGKFLLENDNFRQQVQKYQENPVRRSVLAGKSFPAEPTRLEQFLEEVMQEGTGEVMAPSKIKAFLCPHIDIPRGKKSYARAYHALQTGTEAEVYVIFGTAHYAYPKTRFVFTRKSYETPYGTLPTDGEFIDRVQKKTSCDLFEYEIIHKGEHSVEFQVLFLQHTMAKKKPIRIVPILVGPFEDCMENETSPAEDPRIVEVLTALRETAAEIGDDKICWIASADLSHVGMRFGAEKPPDDSLLQEIREADADCLHAAQRRDPEGFFKSLAQHGNRYQVCGVSPIYAMLYMIQGDSLRGDLLEYEQSVEDEMGSVVTFSSMNFSVLP